MVIHTGDILFQILTVSVKIRGVLCGLIHRRRLQVSGNAPKTISSILKHRTEIYRVFGFEFW